MPVIGDEVETNGHNGHANGNGSVKRDPNAA
jgi:hypothetical protein